MKHYTQQNNLLVFNNWEKIYGAFHHRFLVTKPAGPLAKPPCPPGTIRNGVNPSSPLGIPY